VNTKIPNIVVVLILAPILVAMGCWIIFGETSISQKHRMRLAREFLPVITSAVHSHPEFEDVVIQTTTSAQAGLWVIGTVKTEQQRTELQSVIASTKPPVSYLIRVKVSPVPEFLPNTETSHKIPLLAPPR
jgi:hypothetical protein